MAAIIRGCPAIFDPAGADPLSWKKAPVRSSVTPHMLRMAGVISLFVAWGSLLAARGGDMSAREAGAVVTGFCMVMIAVHVAGVRRARRDAAPADSNLAALFGAVPLVAGLVLLLWRDPGIDSTELLVFRFANDVAADALLVAAVVYFVAYALTRQPRWLLIGPVVLVLGLVAHLASGADVTLATRPGGDWTEFAVTLAAVLVLLVIGRVAPRDVEQNLLVAASLLTPLVFAVVPAAGGRHAARNLVGAALLAGLAGAVGRRLTLGMGAGLLLLAGLEIASLSAYGDSLAPAALFGFAGVGLFALSLLAERQTSA
jgi:hypothetical protein